jgi:DNA polymerase-3 subunit delta
MQNGSLFAAKRLFIIKNAEGIKKKEDIDLIASFTASPTDDTYLIMVSEETNAAKGLEKYIPPANKRIFWELADSRKTEWVQNFFRKEGYTISAEGTETILELVENNTAALKQECSRLILFLKKSEAEGNGTPHSGAHTISAEIAEQWLSHTREESPFTLFTRIASGDLSRSLESVRVLLAAKETPPAIFAGLASCFRKLFAYLSLKEAGVYDEGEMRKIGISSPGAKRDYAAAGKRYTTFTAETCIALTAEYDLLLRQAYSFPEHILMDEYLYKIYNLGTQAGR